MNQIVPTGEYYKQDDQGFILNSCATSNIKGFWAQAVSELASVYRSIHGENLHSVYLRGSVPRGLMVEFISDIDSFCLVKSEIKELVVGQKVAEAVEYFARKYPKINGVEFDCNIMEVALENYADRFFLKTQSLCVWGEDVIPSIESMKISIDSMVTYQHIQKINDIFVKDSEELNGADDAKELCSWVFKAALRTAFEVVMLREMKYTRDLYLCWETYIAYYPSESVRMKQVLQLAISPVSNIEQIKELWKSVYEILHLNIEQEEHLLAKC